MSQVQPLPLLTNVPPLQIRAIHFLDNEGDLKDVPTKNKAFRKAITAETERRLRVEIKDILKHHPSKKKRLNAKYRKLSPSSLQKELQSLTLPALTKLIAHLHA